MGAAPSSQAVAYAPFVSTAITSSPLTAREDHVIVIEGATWSDYQRHLELRGERSVPRITFLEDRLEFMCPSRFHEQKASRIGRLVETWCQERGVDFEPCGSWTIEGKDVKRGCEPDECYVFGEVDEPERPDLAIVVVWTSGGILELDVYERLGVPEVWIWKEGVLRSYALEGGEYVEIEGSRILPGIDLRRLAGFLDHPKTRQAIADYREALRKG